VRALFRAVDVATKCIEATLGGCAGNGCAEIGVEREVCRKCKRTTRWRALTRVECVRSMRSWCEIQLEENWS